MKLRLFCFLSALFVVAGLLLPSGVYAADAQTSAPTVTVDDTTSTDSCNNSTATTASTAVAVDATPTTTDGDEPGTSNQCDDGNNDSNYSGVSWNS